MKTLDALRILTGLNIVNCRLGRILINDYEKDPDPDHWRTISGAKVHLDENGNYDGGANGKFNGAHHWGGSDWREKNAKVSALHILLSKYAGKKQQNVEPIKSQSDIIKEKVIRQKINNLEDKRKQLQNETEKALTEARKLRTQEALKKCEKLVNQLKDLNETIDRERDLAAGKGVLFISKAWHTLEETLAATNVEEKKPAKLLTKLSSKEIVNKIAGGDMTKGSCASVGLAYIANKKGLDVLDFRGGISRKFFANPTVLRNILKLDNIKSEFHDVKVETTGAADILLNLEKEKEYYFVAGRHAAIVKNTGNGVEYLEMQSEIDSKNGWQLLGQNKAAIKSKLNSRFGCAKTQRSSHGYKLMSKVFFADVNSMTKSEELARIVGYLNTAEGKELKGAEGHVK